MTSSQIYKKFQTIYKVTTFVGILSIFLTFCWLFHYRNGLDWRTHGVGQYNYHTIFSLLGMIFFYSQAILVYRSRRASAKLWLKTLHGVLHCAAFLFTIIGLQAVFETHMYGKPPVTSMCTIHSWLGMLTMVLFSIQLIMGLVTFTFPGISKNIKQSFLPYHSIFGVATFLLSVITCMMGFTSKAIKTLNETYEKFTTEGFLVNIIGVLLTVYAILVLYLINNKDYKRNELPNDELMLTKTDNVYVICNTQF